MAKGRARTPKAKTRRAKAKISGTPKGKARTEAKMETGTRVERVRQKTATKAIAHLPHGRADQHPGKTLAVKLECLCGLLNEAHVGMIEDTPRMTRDTPPTTAGKIEMVPAVIAKVPAVTAKVPVVIAKVPVEIAKAPLEIAKALAEMAKLLAVMTKAAAEIAKAMEKAPINTAAIGSHASQAPATDAMLAALLPRGSLHLPAILHRLLPDKAPLEQSADHRQLDLPLRLL